MLLFRLQNEIGMIVINQVEHLLYDHLNQNAAAIIKYSNIRIRPCSQ